MADLENKKQKYYIIIKFKLNKNLFKIFSSKKSINNMKKSRLQLSPKVSPQKGDNPIKLKR